MIYLRNMRADEFPDYVAYFIPDYAKEISSNYDVDIETAHAKASAAVNESLENGVKTPGQDLLCAIVEGDDRDIPVGYFWCTLNEMDRAVFISDFCILPPYRGRGFGRAALVALETWFTKTTYKEFRLRVAADNKIAERLYLSAGYMPTGINMRRPLQVPNGETPAA